MVNLQKKCLRASTHAERIMGRHVIDDDTGSIVVDWPGVRLDFTGITNTSSVAIRMNGNLSCFGFRVVAEDEDEPKDINGVNDDDLDDKLVLVTTGGDADYNLYENLEPDVSYKVSIWKRDDPMNGGATIHGVLVDYEGRGKQRRQEEESHLFQVRPNTRLLEFVGDSDTVGFGINGKKSTFMYFVCCQMGLMSMTHSLRKATDVTKSWAHLTAQYLEADYSVVAWSGIGVKWSTENDQPNMLDAYTSLLPSADGIQHTKVEPRDASFFGPDPTAVVVYIGQNDEYAKKDDKDLRKAYAKMLKKIREYRPAPTPIIVIVPALDCKLACAFGGEDDNRVVCERQNRLWKGAVEDVQGESQQICILEHKHDPDLVLNSEKDYAICLHWNADANEKWAVPLAPKIRKILNWDS